MGIIKNLRNLQEHADTEEELTGGLRELFMQFWAAYMVVVGLIIIAFCFYLGFINYPEPYDFKIFGWG